MGESGKLKLHDVRSWPTVAKNIAAMFAVITVIGGGAMTLWRQHDYLMTTAANNVLAIAEIRTQAAQRDSVRTVRLAELAQQLAEFNNRMERADSSQARQYRLMGLIAHKLNIPQY